MSSIRPVLSVILAFLAGSAVAQDATKLSGEDLVNALRGGGFNIYFRHAQTDWSQTDHVRRAGDWHSCDPERIRQLSEQGRRTAREVGAAIRALGIPAGQVLSSPYCRTVETARLMGLGPVQSTTAVMNMRVAEYFGGREAIVSSARALLATPAERGGNTIIVAHGNVARDATPVYPGEAEGVVFRPDGTGGFQAVARVTPDEWQRLAREFGGR
jgi:broad specificity phosphatase PhoE